MKINKYEIFDPANLDVSKIYQRNFQSQCHLAQLFLDTSAVILRKQGEIVGEFFSPALEMQFVTEVQIQTFTDED